MMIQSIVLLLLGVATINNHLLSVLSQGNSSSVIEAFTNTTKISNIANSSDASWPHAATDEDGTWIVVWSSFSNSSGESDIMYSRSVDNGVTWSTPAFLNSNAKTDINHDRNPTIAVNKKTNVWMCVWDSDFQFFPNSRKDRDIYFSLSSNAGLTWSPIRPLNANAETDSTDDTFPKVASDSNGTWLVGWEMTDGSGIEYEEVTPQPNTPAPTIADGVCRSGTEEFPHPLNFLAPTQRMFSLIGNIELSNQGCIQVGDEYAFGCLCVTESDSNLGTCIIDPRNRCPNSIIPCNTTSDCPEFQRCVLQDGVCADPFAVPSYCLPFSDGAGNSCLLPTQTSSPTTAAPTAPTLSPTKAPTLTPTPPTLAQTKSPTVESRYYFFNELKTFFEAQAFCVSIGTNLATVITSEEFNSFPNDAFWIGLHDLDIERGSSRDGWVWVSGVPYVTSPFWNPSEPNSLGGNEEDCVEFTVPSGFNDLPCTELRPFACDGTTKSPTNGPTTSPTRSPTLSPTTKEPTLSPTTKEPTLSPTTKDPTTSPTTLPTSSPTTSPTALPTKSPTTKAPTKTPTKSPTKNPTSNSALSRFGYDHIPCPQGETSCLCINTNATLNMYWDERDLDVFPGMQTSLKPFFTNLLAISASRSVFEKTCFDICDNTASCNFVAVGSDLYVEGDPENFKFVCFISVDCPELTNNANYETYSRGTLRPTSSPTKSPTTKAPTNDNQVCVNAQSTLLANSGPNNSSCLPLWESLANDGSCIQVGNTRCLCLLTFDNKSTCALEDCGTYANGGSAELGCNSHDQCDSDSVCVQALGCSSIPCGTGPNRCVRHTNQANSCRLPAPTNPTTKSPTRSPTAPTKSPTKSPTKLPTKSPTKLPTKTPTRSPTTRKPTTSRPTFSPTFQPTFSPTTSPTAPTRVNNEQFRDIVYARSSNDGASWSFPASFLDRTKSLGYQLSVTSDENGTFVAAFMGKPRLPRPPRRDLAIIGGVQGSGDGFQTQVHIMRSENNGLNWVLSSVGNSQEVFEESFPKIAVDSKSGTWVTVWQTGTSEFSIIMFSVSTNKGKTWSFPSTVNQNSEPQLNYNPSITYQGENLWLCTWLSSPSSIGSPESFTFKSSFARAPDFEWSNETEVYTESLLSSEYLATPFLLSDHKGSVVSVALENSSAIVLRSKLVTIPPVVEAPPTNFPTLAPTNRPTFKSVIPVSARFTSDGTQINLTFDGETNFAGTNGAIRSCDTMIRLKNETGHLCSWDRVSRKSLLISLRSSTAFNINDLIFFITGNNIRHVSGNSAEVLSGTNITVLGPEQTPTVTVILEGPSATSLCNIVRIRSSVSGSGGREFVSYQWSISPSISNVILNRPNLEFNGSLLSSGETYVFTLTVENWLGGSGSSLPFSLAVATEEKADVTINSASKVSLSADKEFDVSAVILLRSECVAANKKDANGRFNATYNYTWSSSPTFSQEIVTIGNKSQRFRIPGGSLSAGTYTISVDISTSVGVSGSSSMELTILNAPMVAAVVGGASKAVSEGVEFALDASKSCDPNIRKNCKVGLGLIGSEATRSAAISWSCVFSSAEIPCDIEFVSDEPILRLDETQLKSADSPYKFTATASAVDSSAAPSSISVTVTVLPLPPPGCILPKVLINPLPFKLNAVKTGVAIGAKVEVIGNNSQPVDFLKWEEVVDNQLESVLSSGLARQNNLATLVILPNTLVPDILYTFRLTAVQSCTSGKNAFADITFKTNSAPRAGAVSVLPESGRAGIDVFTITASLFEDDADDLPLKYAFEIIVDSSSGIPSSLSDFTFSSSVSTTLPLPVVNGTNLTIIALASDSLGAETGRNVRTSQVLVTSELDLNFNAADALAAARSGGASEEDVLRATSALASALVCTENCDSPEVKEYIKEQQTALLEGLFESQTSEDGTSPKVLAMQAGTLLSLLRNPAGVDEDVLKQASDYAKQLIASAEAEVDNLKNGDDDPFANSIIPETFGDSTIGSMENLLSSLKDTFGLQRMRRMLQGSQSSDYGNCGTSCDTLNGVRSTIRNLVKLLLKGAVVGGQQKEVKGVSVELLTIRELAESLGSESGTNTLTLPSGVSFRIPRNVTSGIETVNGSSVPSTLDIAVIRFRFNVRELLQAGTIVPDAEGAPLTEIEDIYVLDFQDPTNPDTIYHPQGLEEKIIITMPLDPKLLNYVDPSGKATNYTCGAWDEEINGWTADGCTVIEVLSDSIVCECNHATDYGAWSAFAKDLEETFDVGKAATIAIIVIAVMIPLVFLIWFAFAAWGRRRDVVDADLVHRGAFLLLLKNRIKLQQKQRKFFHALRLFSKSGLSLKQIMQMNADAIKNASASASAVSGKDEEMNHLRTEMAMYSVSSAVAQKKKTLAVSDTQEKHMTCMKRVRRFFRVHLREHSLFNIFIRFDPFYTRVQRVTVFVAIVCGNLMISSLMFELNDGANAADLSAGFIIGVAILSALIMTIPVKLIVRFIFRAAAPRPGSLIDRVIEIYRISGVEENILPDSATPAQKADFMLILAFRRLYVASHRLMLVSKARDRQLEAARLENATENGDAVTQIFHKRRQCVNACDSFFTKCVRCQCFKKSGKSKTTINLNDHEMVKAVRGNDATITIETIRRAQKGLDEARQNLIVCKQRAAEEYAKSGPVPTRKQQLVRNQRNAALKIAAVLADESSERPVLRKSYCRPEFQYVAWILVLGFYGAALALTSLWLINRLDVDGLEVDENGIPIDPEILKAQNKIISTWLLSSIFGIFLSYLVSEPVVSLIRFTLCPACLAMCGTTSVEKAELTKPTTNAVVVGAEATGKANKDAGSATEVSNQFFDLLTELAQAF